MSMNNDSTLPSPLGPVDTMPSQLGPAEESPRRLRKDPPSNLPRYVWLGALVAGAYLIVKLLVP